MEITVLLYSFIILKTKKSFAISFKDESEKHLREIFEFLNGTWFLISVLRTFSAQWFSTLEVVLTIIENCHATLKILYSSLMP